VNRQDAPGTYLRSLEWKIVIPWLAVAIALCNLSTQTSRKPGAVLCGKHCIAATASLRADNSHDNSGNAWAAGLASFADVNLEISFPGPCLFSVRSFRGPNAPAVFRRACLQTSFLLAQVREYPGGLSHLTPEVPVSRHHASARSSVGTCVG
jgi:hypothetical protein